MEKKRAYKMKTCDFNVKFDEFGGPINPSESKTRYTVLSSFKMGYPDKTGYHCWWCTYAFHTPPIGVPKRTSLTEDTFFVIGNFCSFACCLAYALEDKTLKVTTGDLIYMYHKMTGKRDVNYTDAKLKPAPSRYILEKFGGRMSIGDFRALGPETTVVSLIQPQIPMNMVVESTTTDISDLCIRMAKVKTKDKAKGSNGGGINRFVNFQ